MNTLKRNVTIILLLLVAILVAGCQSKTDANEQTPSNPGSTPEKTVEQGTPVNGGEVSIGSRNDITTFDPIKGTHGNDHVILWPIFDTLTKFSSQLELEPGLAESWEIPDEKTVILHLREGVTFHDGTEFNAEAVKYNLDRVNAEGSAITELASVESVEVIDNLTVKLNLNKPDASILMVLSDRGGMMISPTAHQELGEDFIRNPVGAGPFKFVSHVSGGEIVFERNENYWQEGKPYLDKLVFKIIADENARVNALKSGELDFIDNVTAENVMSLEKDPNLTITQNINMATPALFLNTDFAPFDDKKFRQAISYAINREEIVQALTFGKGEVRAQTFASNYWAADPNLTIEYDPEKSKQLLEESSVEDPTFKLIYFATGNARKQAEIIKSQLEKVGINAEVEPIEAATGASRYTMNKDLPIVLAGWSVRPDPQMSVQYLYSSTGVYNPSGHSTPEIDSLIVKAAGEYDQEKRAKIYHEISKLSKEEAVFIPLYGESYAAVMNKKVKGFEPNLLSKPTVADLWVSE